jgi:hypothetical protein
VHLITITVKGRPKNDGITIMTKSFLFISLFLLATMSSVWAAPGNKTAITMSIPEAVLVDTIKKSLPVQLSQTSDTLKGVIAIKRIDNLNLEEQILSAHLLVTGTDMQVNTQIAGHQIALKVGNVQLDFNLTARIRFDESTQTLFILPQLTELAPDGNQKSNEIGALLLSVFNGKEIPIVINKLQPIITNTGNRQLAINMHVKDIVIEPDALVLSLLPDIKAIKASK